MDTLLSARTALKKIINRKVNIAHGDSDIILMSYSCNHNNNEKKFSYKIEECNDEILFSAKCYINTNGYMENDFNSLEKVKLKNIKIQNEDMYRLREIAGKYGMSSVFSSFKPEKKENIDSNQYSLCVKWDNGESAVIDSVGSESNVLRHFFEGIIKRELGVIIES